MHQITVLHEAVISLVTQSLTLLRQEAQGPVGLCTRYLRPRRVQLSIHGFTMGDQNSFLTGDLAEILSGPFQRRLCVVLRHDENSQRWFVAVYYPSANCFIHTYLTAAQLKVIGHMAETSG